MSCHKDIVVMTGRAYCFQLSENFSETPAFKPKSILKPPKVHASLEVFLSRLEKELFSDNISKSTQKQSFC